MDLIKCKIQLAGQALVQVSGTTSLLLSTTTSSSSNSCFCCLKSVWCSDQYQLISWQTARGLHPVYSCNHVIVRPFGKENESMPTTQVPNTNQVISYWWKGKIFFFKSETRMTAWVLKVSNLVFYTQSEFYKKIETHKRLKRTLLICPNKQCSF